MLFFLSLYIFFNIIFSILLKLYKPDFRYLHRLENIYSFIKTLQLLKLIIILDLFFNYAGFY